MPKWHDTKRLLARTPWLLYYINRENSLFSLCTSLNEHSNMCEQFISRVELTRNPVVGKLCMDLYFDKKNGVIEIESGLLLKDLLPIITQEGWFIPVTPGTKYVSLGGMVANNIHGKNTYKNQIKYYIKKIKLITVNKKIILCSKKKNKKIFDLTIGGYGLSGIILTITLKLRKIYSVNMDQKIVEFKNFTRLNHFENFIH